MKLRPWLTSALLALTCLAAVPGRAAEDAVVARVGGEEIRKSEVDAAVKAYARDYKHLNDEGKFNLTLDRLIDARLLARAAREAKVHEKPEVKRQLAALERQLLQQAYLGELIAEATTEKALRERYKEVYEDGNAKNEIRARHILTYTQGAAEEVIRQLQAGADFAALAREKSIGPSAKEGGDLGWFDKDDMVPAFTRAAFDLAPGEYTKEPVETEFGWHVIKVEEARTGKAPPFEQAKPELERRAAEDVVIAILKDMRAKVKVDKTWQ